jgi:hypothetical protein
MPNKDSTVIQTLLFSKSEGWTLSAAKKWAAKHKYKASKTDENDKTIRLRQIDPADIKEGSFRTIVLAKGKKKNVKAVIGKRK